MKQRVLIACEESQAVCTAFRKRGFEAYSCDILPCSGGHPEWHIQDDALKHLNEDWDLIIAHPPCTDLAVSGARHFEKKRADGRQREAIEFFCKFLELDCKHVAIENPVGIISGNYIKQYFPDLAEKYSLPLKQNQIIHPWMFGDNQPKATCLWLKDLPNLIPLVNEQPEIEYVEWIDNKTGKKKRQAKWMFDALKLSPSKRSKVRSKTFQGIADAMAKQWGDYIMEDYNNDR